MKNRTCPNCNYKYSKKLYLKKLYFKFIWQSWRCEECGMLLKFDLKSRIIHALIITITLFGIFQMKDFFETKWVYCVLSIITLLFVTVLVSFFEQFRLVNANRE